MTKEKRTGKKYELNEGFTKRGGLGRKPKAKRPVPPAAHEPKPDKNPKE